MAMANRVRQFREARGETLRELGAQVGIDWAHLARIERGERGCPDEKKVALAEHFGVSVTDLFFQRVVASKDTAKTAS